MLLLVKLSPLILSAPPKKMSHGKKPDGKIDFAVGGQAIMEGVMMRSPHFYTMAVRRANKEIVSDVRLYISLVKRSKFWALPLMRGIATLYESLKLGISALMFSNNIMMEDIDAEEAKKKGKKKAKKKKEEDKSTWMKVLGTLGMALYFVVMMGVALFLFKFLPLFVADKASHVAPLVESHYWIYNLVDGVVKVAIFVGYVSAISLMPDIRRVFAYHGAEHQAIWAYEKGKKLTIKNAQAENPEHPRCGTSFIVLVLIVSVLLYTVMPPFESFWEKLGSRIAILPLIAGLSYEVLRISAKHEDKWWMGWVTRPGLWIQKITTRKPDDEMEEVAIVALNAALKAEKEFKG